MRLDDITTKAILNKLERMEPEAVIKFRFCTTAIVPTFNIAASPFPRNMYEGIKASADAGFQMHRAPGTSLYGRLVPYGMRSAYPEAKHMECMCLGYGFSYPDTAGKKYKVRWFLGDDGLLYEESIESVPAFAECKTLKEMADIANYGRINAWGDKIVTLDNLKNQSIGRALKNFIE